MDVDFQNIALHQKSKCKFCVLVLERLKSIFSRNCDLNNSNIYIFVLTNYILKKRKC